MADTTLPAPKRRRFLWVPLIAVLMPVAARGFMYAAATYDLGDGMFFTAMMLLQFSVMLAVLLISAWFFLLSGFNRKMRLAAAVLLVAGIVAAYFAVKKIEFGGNMDPHVTYVWDKTADEELSAYREAAPKAAAAPADLTPAATDSPTYRGTGSTVPIAADWDANKPVVKWRHPSGGGHSGIAVAGNSCVTLEQRGDDECVVCYDRETGAERWVHATKAKFSHSEPMGGGGPRSTPTIHDGSVYALGATGELCRLNGVDGKPVWQENILSSLGATNIEWALTASPLVLGESVIVNHGEAVGKLGGADRDSAGPTTVTAFDRGTGSVKWTAGSNKAAYASPMKVAFAGVEQALIFDSGGLLALDPKTGQELWAFPWKSPMDMNSAQPVVVGANRLFVSSEKDNGSALLELSKSVGGTFAVKPVWKMRKFNARYCTPVLVGEHLYGLSDGRLCCLKAETGDLLWKDGDFGNGQIVAAGDKLVITAEKGGVHLVAADPAAFTPLASLPLFTTRTWNTPALAGKQLYARNHREIARVDLP